ncbi:MAG TPA: DUF1549 domain-containing protein [Thermoanaerobaculia bacterium]|nr:DUF1549 domain-containing protein [Thermoanaerobaculia bacterium]
MRHRRTLTGALIPLLALGAAVVTGSRASEEVQTAPRAECTYDPSAVRSSRELAHLLSRNAELVAPATVEATSTHGKRRSVAPPSGSTFVARNFIDSEIFGKMVKDNIRWTIPATDEEFLRRVTLDLTGQIPTADKVNSFLADTSADKRDRLIDELLASDGFVDRWTIWFGDLVGNVQVTANIRESYQGRNAYYSWIRQSFQSDKPYDQMVRESIAANGSSFSTGTANYWVRQILTNGPAQDTYDNMSAATGEQFLGLPLNCLSCHNGKGHLEAVNSSLASRTRYEFWKNAAFFAQVTVTTKRDPNTNAVEYTLADNATGAYRLNTNSGNKTPRQPATGQANTVDPSFFLSGEAPQSNEPRRQAYARIVTASPQFARASVNYIWKEIFGIGIVEPADSFDLLRQDAATLAPGAALQPTHPELLGKLADYFVSNGYSVRALVKLIVQSNTYQLSSRYTPGPWSEIWTTYYARHYPRRILAESVLDGIVRATAVPIQFTVNGLGPITRAMALPDPTEPNARSQYGPFLTAFGRGDRDTTPRTSDGSIIEALEMLNDPAVTTRVRAANPSTTVAHVLAATKDPGTIADELYIATLSRRPTAAERESAIAYLKSGTLAQKAEDLQYALMNRLEFLFN